MSAFLVLVRMRLLDTLRNRSSVGFTLVFPVVLLAVLGLVFMNGHPFERRYVAVVSTGTESAAIERCVAELGAFEEVRVGRERTEAEALGKLRARMASAVLSAAPDGEGVILRVGTRDRIFGGGLATALPAPARLDVVQGPAWGYVHYLFPGILAFSVLASGLFGMGYPMALFRQNLFLKKLATTPLPKGTFIAANVAARSSIVLVQVVLLVGAARLFFDLPLTLVSFGWLLVISMLGVITFLGAGFALATAIDNAELLVDVISAINMPIVFLSEMFFPLESLPRFLSTVGALLPSTEMVRLSRAVLLYGVTDVSSLAGGLGMMALWAAATFGISLASFKWHA
ncbi:ABC transporter permease [Polyangium jinanense]|uniref:Transport permease protein n=1 Tax=Polyangium jinanense TaxID=2829994 RepID=A0A9X3X1F1_9BACT|nr:ABC transporter permease [Polyangium jinanense]MDC3955720.1 ABC transporter permease [Polyangium jinanense]MDC3982362.1 ABC transporter permease [Polyangium jinanense]